MCPYKAMYNHPTPVINFQCPTTKVPTVNQLIKERCDVQKLSKENLQKTQERMVWYANKKRTGREFTVGDEVFLKLQPYKHMSMQMRDNHKLSAKFYDAYTILKRIGKVAYQLEFPLGARIHHTFHESQLKKKIGSKRVVQIALPKIIDQYESLTIPEMVPERRLVKKGNRSATMMLVQWKNGTP